MVDIPEETWNLSPKGAGGFEPSGMVWVARSVR